jgi:hypothetical protein
MALQCAEAAPDLTTASRLPNPAPARSRDHVEKRSQSEAGLERPRKPGCKHVWLAVVQRESR